MASKTKARLANHLLMRKANEPMAPSANDAPSRVSSSNLEFGSSEALGRMSSLEDEINLLRRDIKLSRDEFALLHHDVKKLLLSMQMRDGSGEEPLPDSVQGTDDATSDNNNTAEFTGRLYSAYDVQHSCNCNNKPNSDSDDKHAVDIKIAETKRDKQKQPTKKKNKNIKRKKRRKPKKFCQHNLVNSSIGDRMPTQFFKRTALGLISIAALLLSVTVGQHTIEQKRERRGLRNRLVDSNHPSSHIRQGDTVNNIASKPPTISSSSMPSDTLSTPDTSSIIPPTSSPTTFLERCPVADKTTCGCDIVYKADYRGQINETITEKECLRWDDEIILDRYGDLVQAFSYGGLEDNNFCRNPANSSEGLVCFPRPNVIGLGGLGMSELCASVPSCDPCSCMPPCDQTSTAKCGCPSVLQSQECCGDNDADCKCNYLKDACRISLENNSTDFCLEAELECGCNSSTDGFGASDCRCSVYEQMCIDSPEQSTCEMASQVCCSTITLSTFNIIPACLCNFYKYTSSALDYESEYEHIYCNQAAAEHVNTASTLEKEYLEYLYVETVGDDWIDNSRWLNESVPHCKWFGIKCDDRGFVIEIILNNNNLTGFLSVGLVDFNMLEKVDISNNNLLGLVDGLTTLFLQDLTYIDLSGNEFTGHAEMLFSSEMKHANFSNNNFTSISFRRFNAAYESLEVVDLSNNLLDQDVSDAFNNIPPNLVKLDLSGNFIRGALPEPFPSLRSLKEFSIANNNMNGRLPDFSRFTPQVIRLDLSNQMQHEDGGLAGTIPENIFKLVDLAELNLAYNKLTGGVPPRVGNMLRLKVLNVSSNALNSSIPPQFGLLEESLKLLDMSNNLLQGRIPAQLGDLPSNTVLHLRGNSNLYTPAPLTLCSFYDFDIKSDEDFCPPERNALKEIYESAKGLEWTESEGWMDEYTNHCYWYSVECDEDYHVIKLDLRSDGLSGTLSKSIAELRSLAVLDLSDNEINGEIPTEIGFLSNLTYVRLSYNSFQGNSTNFGSLKKLQFIQLHGNKLSGSLPRLNLSLSGLSSFVSDCGQPSIYEDHFYCDECTMCCNAQGGCYPQRPTNIENAGFDSYLQFSWVVFACIICTVFALALVSYIFIHDKCSSRNSPTPALSRSASAINRDSKSALEVIGEDSVYQFVLGKSWLAWGVVVGVIASQIGILFIFVKGAEIDITDENSDLVYSWECTRDNDDCRNMSDVNWRGWTAFIVLMCAHLLKDVVNGARMIVMSTKQRHNRHTWFRFFFGGMLLATVSLFTLYASAVYNSAIATSNTELVANSVIILFVADLDECFYDILVVINSSWVESVSYTEEESNDMSLGAPKKDDLIMVERLEYVENVAEELRKSMARMQEKVTMQENFTENEDDPQDIAERTS